MSSAACAPPTCSNAIMIAARSSRCRTASSPSDPASVSAGAAAKVMRACERVGSNVSTLLRTMPAPCRSTTCSVGAWPEARDTTTAISATSPSATGDLVPVSLPSASVIPSLRASVAPGRSAKAKLPMASPVASFGRYRSFWSLDPNSAIASEARYTDEENGTGAMA